jgi:hypothetical protein
MVVQKWKYGLSSGEECHSTKLPNANKSCKEDNDE